MRPAPALIALAVLLLSGPKSWSQTATAQPAPDARPRPAAHLMVGAFARLGVVFRTLLAPATTRLDSLNADGSILTIPARTLPPSDGFPDNDEARAAAWPIGDHICSSPQTCCQLHGGIWMDGRCH